MRKTSEGPYISDGSRALRKFVETLYAKKGVNLVDWCSQHGLERIGVQRAIHGERRHITIEFAHAVEKATRGAVPMTLWREGQGQG